MCVYSNKTIWTTKRMPAEQLQMYDWRVKSYDVELLVCDRVTIDCHKGLQAYVHMQHCLTLQCCIRVNE